MEVSIKKNQCDLNLTLTTLFKITIILLSDVPFKSLKLLFETFFVKRQRKKDIWGRRLKCPILYTGFSIKTTLEANHTA
ncbi:hypothetical protein ALC57_10931 [Trachymyrmex cornetzi]|uniref:Uncharacterized protein n=1 Tax=Trachymyrmex cornetzi TaxID=471704 RepID=A0A195DVZ6_9HYME|nr:hypothetical protein ALC57_10931 [Trachymyrmex cornetzi]